MGFANEKSNTYCFFFVDASVEDTSEAGLIVRTEAVSLLLLGKEVEAFLEGSRCEVGWSPGLSVYSLPRLRTGGSLSTFKRLL